MEISVIASDWKPGETITGCCASLWNDENVLPNSVVMADTLRTY